MNFSTLLAFVFSLTFPHVLADCETSYSYGDCGDLTVNNSDTSLSCGSFFETRLVSCNDGYSSSEGNTFTVLCIEASWDNVHTCDAVACPALTVANSGSSEVTVSTDATTTVTCDDGYTSSSGATFTATCTGTAPGESEWLNVLSCDSVACPALNVAYSNSSSWKIVARTTGSGHSEMGNMGDITYADDSASTGIYGAFYNLTGISSLKLLQVETGQYATYTLLSTLTESLFDTIIGCGASGSCQSEPSATQWSYSYAGTKTAGDLTFCSQRGTNQVPNYAHICGCNEESDKDHSIMAFTDYTGQTGNGWGDSWRGVSQFGTIWSMWNYDYSPNGWTSSLQGWPGHKTSGGSCNDYTYELYALSEGYDSAVTGDTVTLACNEALTSADGPTFTATCTGTAPGVANWTNILTCIYT